MRSRTPALLAALTLGVAACDTEPPEGGGGLAERGGDETGGEATAEGEGDGLLDCASIEFMVPYAPGGGSDQQVRRIEGALSEHLQTNINIVYREGANGAVGWQALHAAEPNGCTVANVVYPNIVLAAMEDGGESFAADDFTHLGQTEVAPQTVAVALDSPYETIEQLLDAAEADPGSVTMAGTGLNGEVTKDQIEEATGISVAYVPMEGGVGDTIPLLLGGHADAGLFSSSHVEENSDTIRALAIAGDEPPTSESLADAPTFADLGFPTVDLATSWGVLGPPDMETEIAQIWNDAIAHATDDDDLRDRLVNGGLTPLYHDLDEAEAWNREVMDRFGVE